MPQTTPLNALIALAILTSGALLDPAPAQARRFGGGHSSGVSRSISTHSSPPAHTSYSASPSARSTEPTDRPPYPIEHVALPASRASMQGHVNWPDASSALLVRSRIEAAQRRNAAREHDAPTPAPSAYDTPNGAPLPAGTAMTFEAGRPTRSGAAPAEITSRPADPRFAKLTDSQRAPSAPCEFKPVMSDADYIACGANPPQFPSAR